MSQGSKYHVPVLREALVRSLALQKDAKVYDGTCGGGGHSLALLNVLGPDGCLLASDRDAEAVKASQERLENAGALGRFFVRQSRFAAFPTLFEALGWTSVEGACLDLGVSSHQLDVPERGFSYREAGPLDMRMDQSQGQTLEQFLEGVTQEELASVLRDYGEERYAGRIARVILEAKDAQALHHTLDVAERIASIMPAKSKRHKHPARRSFQALRMAVNGELDELRAFFSQIPSYLSPGGRLAVITFHSLEDRFVKQQMKAWENPCDCDRRFPCQCGKLPLGKVLHRKGEVASREECEANPRARSARLRVFVKSEGPQ